MIYYDKSLKLISRYCYLNNIRYEPKWDSKYRVIVGFNFYLTYKYLGIIDDVSGLLLSFKFDNDKFFRFIHFKKDVVAQSKEDADKKIDELKSYITETCIKEFGL